MQIERYRRRWLRRTLNRCTAALIGTMVFCTGITVCAAYSLHMELQQVNKQQTDTLDTLMWHRVFNRNVTHFHSMDFTQPYWTKGKECVGEAGGNRFWM